MLIYPDGHVIGFTNDAELFSANLDQKRNLASVNEAATKTFVKQPPRANLHESNSKLFVMGTYDFYRIDSISSVNQSTALILSDPSFGIHGGWQQAWSNQFFSQVDFKYSQVKMSDTSSGILENASHDLGQVGLSFGYIVTPRLQANLFANYGNELYARAVNSGTATLDSVYRSQIGVSLVPDLFQHGDLDLDLELGIFQNSPQSTNLYTFDKSDGYILAPTLRKKLNKMQMELKLNYEAINQKSSISQQKNTQLGIEFGVSFGVGK